MKLGKLLIEHVGGKPAWGFHVGACGCRILELGSFWVTWLSKYCSDRYREE